MKNVISVLLLLALSLLLMGCETVPSRPDRPPLEHNHSN